MPNIQMRDGSTTSDPRLGRLKFHDPRSQNYQIRELLAEGPSKRGLRAKYWRPAPVLDQGQEGQCVSEGCHGARNGAPLSVKPMILQYAQRAEFYHAAQHQDDWRGCSLGAQCPIDPDAKDRYDGTAVIAGMKEGQKRSWWSQYRWIGAGSGRLEDDIIDTLRGVGGIVFGIDWLEGMFTPNPDGLVNVTGDVAGGHCIHGFAWVPRLRLPKSFKGTKPAVALQNSWGTSWGIKKYGQSGIGYVLLDDLLTLVSGGRGEGAVPI